MRADFASASKLGAVSAASIFRQASATSFACSAAIVVWSVAVLGR
jgi:hypothetical protein